MNVPAAAQPALFAYKVTPDSVAISEGSPSVVALSITVNNATGKKQPCQRIAFTVPVGTEGGDLTTQPGTITPSAALGTAWTISPDPSAANTFTAVPRAAATGLGAGESIAFLLSGVEVNETVGLVEIAVGEDTGFVRETQLAVSKEPPGLTITMFTANPIELTSPHERVTLAWSTAGADSCTLSWNGQGKSVPTEHSCTVTPEIDTTYTLSATGGGTTVNQQQSVVVPRVRILSFSGTPQVPQGGPAELTWHVLNAKECYVEPGHISVDPDKGKLTVYPTVTTQYVLAATGFGATLSDVATVNVEPVTIDSFTASPTLIELGEQATLAWGTRWATGVAIDQGVGTVDRHGTAEVSPQNDTTYTLTADGSGGPRTAPATVEVQSVEIVAFSAQPPQVLNPGDPVELQWTIARSTGQSIDQGVGPVQPAGPAQVQPGQSQTYTLTATGPNGPVTAQAPVIVVNEPAITDFVGRIYMSIPEVEWVLLLGWSTVACAHCQIVVNDQQTYQVPPNGPALLVSNSAQATVVMTGYPTYSGSNPVTATLTLGDA